ncbi:MAG: methyltransferase domain-containing protein [Candidatus Contendobacter sp.]|nr:methyltransferase domain-containing protein [Candidatus Contendobacter sp.]MDS4056980.1 methyltransferase domain-containing protein [Candidatus Contendobacter sp.]
MASLPTHDIEGLHILDPKDRQGWKSKYITLLQERALRRHIPKGQGKLAVDLGCGFGRLTPLLAECGWQAVGIDPSPELLVYANQHYPGPEYRVGGLPNLPIEPATISLLLVQNVLRALKMMNRLELVNGVGRYLAEGARVVLVENLRVGHPAYLPEALIIEMMQQEGLRLVQRVPLRAARWWMIYLIRYGLIPESLYERIAEWELDRMAKRKDSPSWQYWNVLFVFDKVERPS